MYDLALHTLEKTLQGDTRYSDVRVQKILLTDIAINTGDVDSIDLNEKRGIGVRALGKGTWGFTSTNSLNKATAVNAATSAIKKSKKKSKYGKYIELSGIEIVEDRVPYFFKVDPRNVSLEDKIDFLLELDKAAQNMDKKIIKTRISYSEMLSSSVYMNSEGTRIEMNVPRIKLGFSVTSKKEGVYRWMKGGVSGSKGYELVDNVATWNKLKETCNWSVKMLDSRKTPSGKMMVVMDSGVVGLFLHEAFGHPNEADSVLQERSFLGGRIDQEVGSKIVSIVSDPSLRDGVGYYKYDDEGTPASKVNLVKKGVLKSYMHSRETAAAFDTKPTSNARAEDFSFNPIVRMNNLYMEPGNWRSDEIIETTKRGIFIKEGLGGMEDPERGAFQFNVMGCCMIEDGEITTPLRDTSLSGFTIESLKSIDAVSNDLGYDAGTCGKGEPSMQMVPVSNGGPTIRVGKIIIGGSG